MENEKRHQVVIVGGGFGGLNVARELQNFPVNIILLDKQDSHIFSPLLCQVVAGDLAPEKVAYPLQTIFRHSKNVTIVRGEVIDFDPEQRKVILRNDIISYDTLVVAAGMVNCHFERKEGTIRAPSLKTLEDALEIRRLVRLAFASARRETEISQQRAWLTFVVVGGGPTGVELAGALVRAIRQETLPKGDTNIDPPKTKVILLEKFERVLPTYAASLSAQAEETLHQLGVTVSTKSRVVEIEDGLIMVQRQGGKEIEQIEARIVLEAAGLKASPLGEILAQRTEAQIDAQERVLVKPDLSLPGYPDIFVVGDLAHYAHQGEKPLPAVAPVAIQQGRYVARLIGQKVTGRQWFWLGDQQSAPRFRYWQRGKMAVVGGNTAVIDLGGWGFSGYPVWLLWTFVHSYHLNSLKGILTKNQYDKRVNLASGNTIKPVANKPCQESINTLVEIQSDGRNPPFFCVVARYSDVPLLSNLAQHLGADQPFYALQPPQSDADDSPAANIEALVAHYIEQIQSVQAQGPYTLGGFSIGGLIALEMAQQLQASGHEVSLVALIDTPYLVKNPLPYWGYRSAQTVNQMGETLLQPLQETISNSTFGQRLQQARQSVRDTLQNKAPQVVERIEENYQVYQESMGDQGYEAVLNIIQSYKPTTYSGKMALFLASKSPVRYSGVLWFWHSIAPNGLDVYTVSGSYISILKEPGVATLANQLKAHL